MRADRPGAATSWRALQEPKEVPMAVLRARFLSAFILSLPILARAELPLPDATVYGQIKTPAGTAVGTGTLVAKVQRGGLAVLDAPGVFIAADGDVWYVVRIPLE